MKNERKAGLVLSYVSLGIGNLISLFYTPVMLRILGQSEYGLYSLVTSIIGYLGLLNFGFSACYIRFYARYNSEKDDGGVARLNGMFLGVYLAMSLLVLASGAVLTLNTEQILGDRLSASELHTAKILMGILVFNMAISFIAMIFYVYIAAHEKFIFQKLINMLQMIVGPLVMLPVLFMGYGSVGMVIVSTSLNIILTMANMIFCFKKLKIKFYFNQFDFSLMKEMTIFSSFIFINMIIDQINWNVDKYILGRTGGTTAVAIYSIGATLNQYYFSLSAVVLSIYTPVVHKMIASECGDDVMSKMFARIGRLQFLILAPVCSGLIVFGQQFIKIWAGENYTDSYLIMIILVIPVTIPLIQSLGIAIQQAKNLHKFRSLVYLLIAVVNVFISIPLSKKYGGAGCAAGTAMSLLVGNGLIINWYYQKKMGLNITYFWKEISKFVPALIIPVFLGGIIMKYTNINHILPLLCHISLYGCCFLSSMWCFGMNEYEKDIVLKLGGKVSRRIF